MASGACAGELAPGVEGTLYRPALDRPAPAVLVLHGRGGKREAWSAFAQTLAAQGFVALLLDYYAATGHPVSRAEIREDWPDYEAAVARAVAHLQGLAEVRRGGVGVVGFSLGGYLAISSAGRIPGIEAVVSYYGGGTSALDEYVAKLPPVLILHGREDEIVPVAKGEALFQAMRAAGRTVEMEIYPARHCFNCPTSTRFDPWTGAAAEDRAIAFLKRHLGTER